MNLGNVPPDRTLLDLLREDLRLSATKEGCAAGDCGACTVVVAEAVGDQLQYRAVNSCIKPAHAIDGRALWTAADLTQPDGDLHPVQRSLVDCHGSQCGFCTPGLLMATKDLLERNPNPSETEIRFAIAGNLCRCTGYDKIIRAVQAAAAQMRGEAAVEEAK